MKLELKSIDEFDELYGVIEDAIGFYLDKIKVHQGYPQELKYENLYHIADSFLQRLDKLKEDADADNKYS